MFLHGDIDVVHGDIYVEHTCIYLKKITLKRCWTDFVWQMQSLLECHYSHMENCPKTQEAINDMQVVPYASACGSLLYAMVATRPDIAYAMGVVSRFMANPRKAHWNAIKSIMRYLKCHYSHMIKSLRKIVVRHKKQSMACKVYLML